MVRVSYRSRRKTCPTTERRVAKLLLDLVLFASVRRMVAKSYRHFVSLVDKLVIYCKDDGGLLRKLIE